MSAHIEQVDDRVFRVHGNRYRPRFRDGFLVYVDHDLGDPGNLVDIECIAELVTGEFEICDLRRDDRRGVIAEMPDGEVRRGVVRAAAIRWIRHVSHDRLAE